MTDSFGTRLRRERERRHITLTAIAASTKIKASLFEGLERDDVSHWPAGIFRRSFVRAYAAAIGLDPERICREFMERFPETADSASKAPPAASMRAERPTPALRVTPPAARPAPASSSVEGTEPGELRLMLADAGQAAPDAPEALAPIAWTARSQPDSRLGALAADLGIVLVIAITAFIFLNLFWMPLAVTSLVYFCGSSVLLGRTMGVALFTDPGASAPAEEPLSEATLTSLDRALEMREILQHDQIDPHDHVDAPDMTEAPRVSVPYPVLRQPVDIESRRARA